MGDNNIGYKELNKIYPPKREAIDKIEKDLGIIIDIDAAIRSMNKAIKTMNEAYD